MSKVEREKEGCGRKGRREMKLGRKKEGDQLYPTCIGGGGKIGRGTGKSD